MRYEFENSETGETEVIDTEDIDYDTVWGTLGLNLDERAAANKIIDLFHSSQRKGFYVITRYTPPQTLKAINREEQRHVANHYRTRRELELVSRKMSLVEKLIQAQILELHNKWFFLRFIPEGVTYRGNEKRHPQAPYRLEPLVLHGLETKEREYIEELV